MTTQTMSPSNWKDSKRYLWILSATIPALMFVGWGLYAWTGSELGFWFGFVFLYVIIPILDFAIGTDQENPPENLVPVLEDDRYYRVLTYLFIPLQLVAFVWACWMVSSGQLGWVGLIGLTLSTGVLGGLGINTAHELGHKKEKLERWLSKLTLAQVAYGHFYVEHNKGHHKNVATPEDPASSKLGENFYQFLPRSVIGSLRSAWRIEKERLARLGKGPLTLENENIQAWLMTVVLWAGLVTAFGAMIIPFLVAQAIYGFSLLEVVNFLEHYGLLRQKEANGRYERCRPEHSWNSNNIVTNLFLYQLQRHSDHHANPTRRYQALRHFDEAPQLPSGYASMVLIAYVPPLWRAVMDRRVIEHYRGDFSKMNIYPPAREKYLAKYGSATMA